MKTQIVAIVMIALVGFAGTVSALPEDLIGWDSPSERAYIYADKITAYENMLDRLGMSDHQKSLYMESIYETYTYKIVKYRAMYEHIMVTVLTTDTVELGNGSWSKIGCGREGASQTYVQGLVNAKIAELQATPGIVGIDTEYEVLKRLTTYPGGPVFIRYQYTVTWRIIG